MGVLTKEQRMNLVPIAISRYLEDNGVSQADLSRLSGVSKAYVNQIIHGKETIGKAQIADKYYQKLAHAIGLKLEKTYWKHFNTYNFKMSCIAIDLARENRERLGIDGLTGMGKTYISTMYKRKFPKECIVIKCSGIQNSKEFARDFARACGSSDIGTKNELIKNACETVKNIPNAFIMIDEFENSRLANIIPTVKVIADELEGIAPVILIGINIQEMLKRSADRGKNGFVQVNRRWSWKWTKLDPNIGEDVELICEEIGIKSMAIKNWMKIRVKDFDSLKHICVTALEESEKTGEQVSVSMLNELFN